MKPMAFAALAALAAVARVAGAQTAGSVDPAADAGVRATTEARALVATMQHDARIALLALENARRGRQRGEVRCADEALSRADTALRHGREDADALEEAARARDATATGALLARLRHLAAASHDAGMAAMSCSLPSVVRVADRTQVTVVVDPLVSRVDP